MRLAVMVGTFVVGGIFAAISGSPQPAQAGAEILGEEVKKEKARFTVTTTDVQMKAGATGSANVQVIPAKGYKWNLEYPAKLSITSDPAHVKLAKSTFKQLKGDFKATKEKATVKLDMEATSAGTETLKGMFKFSVCDETTCVIEKSEFSIAVTVAP